MRLNVISFVLISVCTLQHLAAQVADSVLVETSIPENWFNLDPEEDSVLGVSTERAYNTILKNKKSTKVIVAVIDSGIDINHEDLQGSIWINEDEIAENGIDDDNNGYIDDVNGWNFIGNASGENIAGDSYELTREYVRMLKIFENEDSTKQKKKKKELYKYYQDVKKQFEKQKAKVEEEYDQFSNFKRNYTFVKEILLSFTTSDTLTYAVIDSIDASDNEQLAQIKTFYKSLLDNNINDKEVANWQEHLENQLNFAYNLDYDPRSLVGDDYENVKEKFYGNNDVKGPDASHGTHVAGIIGANRNNTQGIKGVADKVSIMAIRAVPDGDERDKDIANAIYYAVDNGAQIINMSFGKSFSPQKEAIDNAVKYAEDKGILIIHAAGNSSKNIDIKDNYPTKEYLGKDGAAQLWIEVGASNTGLNNEFVGDFSNYGKENVNIFAPGCQILSSTPDNKYEPFDGTSMASPVTAGVAALLMSYYPQLSVYQIKDIILNSGKKYLNLEVMEPNTNEDKRRKVAFAELCATGAIINAYEAVQMAESMLLNDQK